MHTSRVISCFAGLLGLLIAGNTFAAGDANQGKTIYGRLCASCHGPTGKGDGPAAAGLNPKPRNFQDAAVMKGLSDDRIRTVILKGGPAVGLSAMMPPWESSLKAGEIDHVIAFLRMLAAGK